MNLNDSVSIILTKSGADIMNQREAHYAEIIKNYKKTEYHEGDELKTQLWCLFEDFGCYINIACDTPFKDNEISTTWK